MKIKPEHFAALRTLVLAGIERIPPESAYLACHESVPRIAHAHGTVDLYVVDGKVYA